MVVILAALSIEGWKVDEWHISFDEGEEEIGREAASDDRGMGYRRSLSVKRRGGSGGLQIVEDVATGSRSGHGLDAIVLERNEGRLGVIRGW
ncbi:hypothetical protein GOBAR_DD08991 [Gossypium barbadense]|uniref:Uncharacterized protein n=1 Tax=Gossypium tomentosum TaxID=34277 RepID=A0A5D2K894_GOSTO|nr:hypothetical protein GOBAR_DD08991 [Gossypium barbadense]TYH63361.1 hypothetical protein ES332_D07G186900v1 [Gossypium tomentosum]